MPPSFPYLKHPWRWAGAFLVALVLAALAVFTFWPKPLKPAPPSPVALFPTHTAQWQLTTQNLFADPMNGLGLRYSHTQNPSLSVDVNIYPVGALYWDNNPYLLDDEADVILNDMDYLVKEGTFTARLNTLREKTTLNGQPALLVHFYLTHKGPAQHRVVLLQQQQDKFVKFTHTSTQPHENPIATLQSMALELLAQLQVQPEQANVQALRQAHRQKMAQKAQQLRGQ